MQFIIHLIFGPDFVGVMPDSCHCLVNFAGLQLRFVKLDRQ